MKKFILSLVLFCITVAQFAQTSSKWVLTSNMVTPRWGHSATLLQDGRILVAGGSDAVNVFASAEIYNPETNKWSSAGNMSVQRTCHTATLLPDGTVLIVGGTNNSTAPNALNSAEIYDPSVGANGTWTTVAATMTTAREGHAAVLLKNGKVLIAAGSQPWWTTPPSSEIYDPIAKTFTATGAMAFGRQWPSLSLMKNGKVLIAGGWSAGVGNDIDNSEEFDPVTQTWSTLVSFGITNMQGEGQGIALTNGKVLRANVNTTQPASGSILYNPATGSWSASGNLALAADGGSLSLLPNNNILMVGGYTQVNGAPCAVTSTCQVYDVAAGTWSTTASLNVARGNQSATVLPDGRIIIIGGNNGTNNCAGALASAEIYTSIYSWTAAANSLYVVGEHSSTPLTNNKVLIAGGSASVGAGLQNAYSSCELYDYTTNTWTATGNMSPRIYHTATMLPNGDVLAAGGAVSQTNPYTGVGLSTYEIYNTASGAWTAGTTTMTVARLSHTATLLFNGNVLVTGGQDQNTVLSACEIFDPATSSWMPVSPMATARTLHTATLLPNGKVLVVSGFNASGQTPTCELYDLCSGSWSAAASLPAGAGLGFQAATLLHNGKVLVSGGVINGGAGSAGEKTCYLYDYNSNTWTATGSMNFGRYAHTITLMPDGRVLVTGGFDGVASPQYLKSTEMYDPISGVWTNAGDFPSQGVARMKASLLPNGNVLVTGGMIWSGPSVAECNIYSVTQPLRPVISSISPTTITIPASAAGYASLTVNGTGFKDNFRNGSEGTGFNYATNYPVIQVCRLGGDKYDPDYTRYLPFDISAGNYWDSTKTVVRFPYGTPNELPAGVYTVKVIANGVPSLPAYLKVNMNCTLAADFKSDTVCLGNPTQFTDLSTPTPTCWKWNFGEPSSGANNTSTVQNPTHTYATAGTFTVVLTASNDMGCTDTVSHTVLVVPATFSVNISNPATICAGQSVTLNAAGGVIYSWSNGAQGSTIVVSPTATTNYTVTVGASGCAKDTSVTITVNPSPVVNLSASATICNGQSVTLTATGGATYQWSNTTNTSSSITISPTSTATYSVIVSSGSCADTAAATITVNAVPVAGITGDTVICQGETTTFTASGGGSYVWNSSTSTTTINPATSGTYSVIVTSTGCSDTAYINLTVNPLPIAVAANNITITQGQSTTLLASGGGSYQWTNGSTDALIHVSPPVTTVYCVTVTDANGCTDDSCVKVTVEPINCLAMGELYLPNAFSPNADNENEVLQVYYGNFLCIKDFEILIYDRWGEKVFESTDPGFKWEGTRKDKDMSTQVFVYYLNATMKDGKEIHKRGNVSLIR